MSTLLVLGYPTEEKAKEALKQQKRKAKVSSWRVWAACSMPPDHLQGEGVMLVLCQ